MQQIEHLNKLYDDWKQGVEAGALQQGLEQGLEQGVLKALRASYAAHFGPLPAELDRALARIRDSDVLLALVTVAATGTRDAVSAAVHEAAGRD